MENPNNFAENRFESWTIDDFFCNKLVGLKQSNAFLGTIFREKTVINGISFIPPIKSQVVEYLSDNSIRSVSMSLLMTKPFYSEHAHMTLISITQAVKYMLLLIKENLNLQIDTQ